METGKRLTGATRPLVIVAWVRALVVVVGGAPVVGCANLTKIN